MTQHRATVRHRILAIGGSLNQTTMMHRIGEELAGRGHECRYSPFYGTRMLRALKPLGVLDRTILAGRFRRTTEEYLEAQKLPVDDGGLDGPYDLVLTCTDLVVPENVRQSPIVLVQEGMTDPEDAMYKVVRKLGLPLWMASTSTTGLSGLYTRFCVASEGYRAKFAAKGAPAAKLVVTGIPNYDDCASLLRNDFPLRDYVLVATSDARETFKRDDRAAFLERCVAIAGGRPLLFKLHPNENWERATREIRQIAPGAMVLTEGRTDHMVANCAALVTQYSTVVYTGLALGKECHSYFDLDELRRLLPVQNGGASARNIADVCEDLLAAEPARRIA